MIFTIGILRIESELLLCQSEPNITFKSKRLQLTAYKLVDNLRVQNAFHHIYLVLENVKNNTK